MTNKEILEKIYRENKSINRNLHCLINIRCIEFFGKGFKKAKKANDKVAMNMSKTGLILVAISEIFALLDGIIDYKKIFDNTEV